MPRFLSPIDLSNLELQNFLLHSVATGSLPGVNRAGQILWDSTVGRIKFNDGSGFVDVYRSDSTNTPNTAVRRDGSGNFSAGTITASLSGNATTATTLATARNIGITGGKVTATAASFNGSADVNINISALSVSVGEIGLTNGNFIVGNASNVGTSVAKNAIPISGFGAAGADVPMGGYKITNLADPVNPQDAATKGYVDTTALGLDVKLSVRYATAAALPAYTYTPGSGTMTASANAQLVIDGSGTTAPGALVVGDRILVKNEVGANAKYNGIYVVNVVGSGATPWVLARAPDFNSSAEASPGSFCFIEEGATNSDTGWVMSSNGPITLDTSDIAWTQFSGAGTYTAGRGIVLSGTQFNFGQSGAYTIGDLPYATGASSIGFIAAVATGNVLISGGAATAPSWGKVGLTSHVSGTLPVANGGTNNTAITTNGVAYGGPSGYAFTAAMTAGQVLVANASAVPTPTTLSGDVTVNSSGITAIGSNRVTDPMLATMAGLSVHGRSANTTGNIGAITGSANQVLRVDSGGTALGFGAINLASGSAVTGTLPIANGGTGLAAVGSANTALVSNGTTASWTQVSLTAGVTGTLPVANGGTGLSAVGSANTVLTSNGSAASWGTVNLGPTNAAVSGTLSAANGGTGSQFVQFAGPGTTVRTYSLPDRNVQLASQVSGTITGNGTTTQFSGTHNLASKNVVVAIYDSSDNQVFVDTKTLDGNNVQFTFAVAPANGVTYRWVVVGF